MNLHPCEFIFLNRHWSCTLPGLQLDIVDERMELNSMEMVEVQRVISTALLCLQHLEGRRPDMAREVSMLQGDSDCEVVDLETSGSEIPRRSWTVDEAKSIECP